MLLYNFNINTYKVDVTAEIENEYHVSLDGVYAGTIFAEFIDEPPFMIWKTRDLIPEDLVQKIGAAIEDEDN
ncbi:hypothetical protein [Pedobacter agri]|uniref:hypothetical protein n=1 Tax=Pedobacter agri TaxID=454586 RepID=UPI002781AC35|nr:hypothetical protein [Pedobacter agri]MDQ1139397.1 hypothetical protein [Pedobacter agri]